METPRPQTTIIWSRFTRLITVAASLFLLWIGSWGCDKLLAIADPNSSEQTEQDKSQGTSDGTDPDNHQLNNDPATEMERYAEARAEITHRMKSVHLSEHSRITAEVIRNHGFNQMTFAAASHKYRDEPEADRLTSRAGEKYKVIEAEAEAAAKAAAAAEEAQKERGAGGDDGDGKTGPAGGEGKQGDESRTREGQPDSKEEEQDLSLVGHLAGQWLGNLSGMGGGTGTLQFRVADNGRIRGTIRVIGPDNYTLNLTGHLTGNRVILKTTGTTPEVNFLELEGAANHTHKGATGAWKGKLNRRNLKGSWRATRRG